MGRLSIAAACALALLAPARWTRSETVTVPFTLDHNRMLVDAEIQKPDGNWRLALLWVDTGNPDFFVSPALAADLGVDLAAAEPQAAGGQFTAPPLAGLRLGGMPLDVAGIPAKVLFQPRWLFDTMHNDANLPAAVLERYHIVFDYPRRRLTLASPGGAVPRGERAAATVNAATGIVQIDAEIAGEVFSFALDNGASYSFASEAMVSRLAGAHPDWLRCAGAAGCANIWGWWPQEGAWPVLRLPEMRWGGVRLDSVGIAGLPDFFGGQTIGAWYSRKTARPVDGFLGPNALKAFRVEIDYAGGAVYFDRSGTPDAHDMDVVGLTLRLDADGVYRVIGIASVEGAPAAEGIEIGDALLEVGDLKTAGATMGTVVDALRGEPGAPRVLLLERAGRRLRVEARVRRLL